MEKEKVQALLLMIFTSGLAIMALSGGNTEQGEMGQIQDAMRSLKRVDNLQYTYVSTFSDSEETVTEQVDVWADQLSGSWVAEYYLIDEDGTLLYQKRFCDGQNVYVYIDWNGAWEQQPGTDSRMAPYLEALTALTYDSMAITDIQKTERESSMEISYTFTPEYLEKTGEESLEQLEMMYRGYENAGVLQAEDGNAQLNIDRYRQTRQEDMQISYYIDSAGVVCGTMYTVNLIQPEIILDESGVPKLGEDETTQVRMALEVQEYNRDAILDKIEVYKNSAAGI